MIVTVFAAGSSDDDHWRSQLLESSWRRASQEGQLVRLFPAAPDTPPPKHPFARVVPTPPWSPHLYTGDDHEGYQLPAAILSWHLREPSDQAHLLLDRSSAFRWNVEVPVELGRMVGTPWREQPSSDDGPFGLGEPLAYLDSVCVDRSLELPGVTLPLLVHGTDLMRIAPRWLELLSLIRSGCPDWDGRDRWSQTLALNIAAAEYGLPAELRPLGVECGAAEADSDEKIPVLGYPRPIEGLDGETVWDPETWEPWSAVAPERAKSGPDRDLLSLIEERITLEQAGGELAFMRPRRREGVREARLLDQMLLEIPGQEEPITLNSSASSIWELVDDLRSIADIAGELEREFEMDRGALRDDVESALLSLRDAGALDVVHVAR